MGTHKTKVFLDTNLFLHYRPLNEVDWCSLLQTADVEIEIAPVVTRELEQQKVFNPSHKLRDRAVTALRLLRKYLTEPQVREGVVLHFSLNEPTADFATSHGLTLQLGDDRLIGTMLSHRDENHDDRFVLVTGDLSLTIKARHYQIEVFSPDETLLLPSEPDPLETKNKKLEAELLRYKSREPVLAVLFEDGKKHARFRLVPPRGLTDPEAEIRSKLAQAKDKVQPVHLKTRSESETPPAANNPFAQVAELVDSFQNVGKQFYEGYNVRVANYHRDYEKYLRETLALKTRVTRTIKMSLVLENSGTCPAEDIHVLLHFPDGFTLYDEKHPPTVPEEPTAPSKEIDLFPQSSLLSSLSYLPNVQARLPLPRDPSLPTIRKTKSYEVTYEYEKLQHGFIWTFTPLFVAFESWESANSFSIDVTIHAGNMIDEQKEQLGVVIEKG